MEHKPANKSEFQHTWIMFCFLMQVSCLFQGKSSGEDAADPFSAVDKDKGSSSQPFAPHPALSTANIRGIVKQTQNTVRAPLGPTLFHLNS